MDLVITKKSNGTYIDCEPKFNEVGVCVDVECGIHKFCINASKIKKIKTKNHVR